MAIWSQATWRTLVRVPDAANECSSGARAGRPNRLMSALDPIAMSEADTPPRVTVVVPLYNGAENLAETLSSIQRQTHRAAEVLVVDDGSTDGGAQVARDHPVGATVLTQPNHGVAVARNHGLAAASGDWSPSSIRTISGIPITYAVQSHGLHSIPMSASSSSMRSPSQPSRMPASWRRWTASQAAGPASELLAARHSETLIERADVDGSDQVARHDVRTMLRGPISMTTSFIADPALLRLAGGFAPHALAMDDYWLLVNVARLTPIARVDQPTVFYRVHTTATSRTTRLGLPFLSSAAALRLGGGLVPTREGLRGGLDGRLHRHLLDELLSSPEYRDPLFRGAVDDLARLLWPRGGHRRSRWRAQLAARAPWLRRAVRALRRR